MHRAQDYLPGIPPETIEILLEILRLDDEAELTRDIDEAHQSTAEVLPHPNHDLASCTLVCRDRRELTRRHIFHYIAIPFRPATKDLRRYESQGGRTDLVLRKLKTIHKSFAFLLDHQEIA